MVIKMYAILVQYNVVLFVINFLIIIIWNPSNYNCECDKSCDVGDYLDYKNCKGRKRLIDKLVEECSEKIYGNEVIYDITLNGYKNVCNISTI